MCTTVRIVPSCSLLYVHNGENSPVLLPVSRFTVRHCSLFPVSLLVINLSSLCNPLSVAGFSVYSALFPVSLLGRVLITRVNIPVSLSARCAGPYGNTRLISHVRDIPENPGRTNRQRLIFLKCEKRLFWPPEKHFRINH